MNAEIEFIRPIRIRQGVLRGGAVCGQSSIDSVLLSSAYFVNQLIFTASTQQSQYFQQGEDDLAIAHQGCERSYGCIQIFDCDLSDFRISMRRSDDHFPDFFRYCCRHIMVEHLRSQTSEVCVNELQVIRGSISGFLLRLYVGAHLVGYRFETTRHGAFVQTIVAEIVQNDRWSPVCRPQKFEIMDCLHKGHLRH